MCICFEGYENAVYIIDSMGMGSGHGDNNTANNSCHQPVAATAGL
jgi:hypothetical protein